LYDEWVRVLLHFIEKRKAKSEERKAKSEKRKVKSEEGFGVWKFFMMKKVMPYLLLKLFFTSVLC